MLKKSIASLLLTLFIVACGGDSSSSSSENLNVDEDFLIDTRDGQTYKTVKIGSQTWMAENLNYKIVNSSCYEDKVENCDEYGRLYTWAAAMDSVGKWSSNGKGCGYKKDCSPSYPVQGVCPQGWHLPQKSEWMELFFTEGDSATAGVKLKSSTGWFDNGNGTDVFGFSALPAGIRLKSKGFIDIGRAAHFWTSDIETDNHYVYRVDLNYNSDFAEVNDKGERDAKRSVRCVKDESVKYSSSSVKNVSSSSVAKSSCSAKVKSSGSKGVSSSSVKAKSSSGKAESSSSVKVASSANVALGFMTDPRDGQTYKTVKIRSQTWMAENLNIEKRGSFCYDNKAENCAKYGRLYLWITANKVCPSGWRVPTTAEWDTLIDVAGGEFDAAKTLKSSEGWFNDGNGGDSILFTVLPAGIGYENGTFKDLGHSAFFWVSSIEYHEYINGYEAFYGDSDSVTPELDYTSYEALSIRCIQDDKYIKSSSSRRSSVTTGSMIDSRDGQTYKTVKIGSQNWMAENLKYEVMGSFCYKDSVTDCSKYGRYYSWAMAMDSAGTWSSAGKGCGYGLTCSPTGTIRGVCPEGWHLPSPIEWNVLIAAVGGSSTAGDELKSSFGWMNAYDGADAYMFSALPAGSKLLNCVSSKCDEFSREGRRANFWSSAEYDRFGVHLMVFNSGSGAFIDTIGKGYANSVRCIQNIENDKLSSSSGKEGTQTDDLEGFVTDFRDFQFYKIVKIGNQTWMAQNLNYSTMHSFCYRSLSDEYCITDGRLYTWSAAMDSAGIWSSDGEGCGCDSKCSPTGTIRGVCPEGWHLPSIAEWDTLVTTVGGLAVAEKILKSTSRWPSYSTGTDDYGFSVLPSGYKLYFDHLHGSYWEYDHEADFWSSTEFDSINSASVFLNDNDLLLVGVTEHKNNAFSVRCVKD